MGFCSPRAPSAAAGQVPGLQEGSEQPSSAAGSVGEVISPALSDPALVPRAAPAPEDAQG